MGCNHMKTFHLSLRDGKGNHRRTISAHIIFSAISKIPFLVLRQSRETRCFQFPFYIFYCMITTRASIYKIQHLLNRCHFLPHFCAAFCAHQVCGCCAGTNLELKIFNFQSFLLFQFRNCCFFIPVPHVLSQAPSPSKMPGHRTISPSAIPLPQCLPLC